MFATYLSPRWGLGVRGLVFYTSSWISIAVAIRFLDPTLGLLEAGARCAPYKCTFQTGSKIYASTYLRMAIDVL